MVVIPHHVATAWQLHGGSRVCIENGPGGALVIWPDHSPPSKALSDLLKYVEINRP